VSGLVAGGLISIKKLLTGKRVWDTRKEILGWLFDGARNIIKLPPKNLDDIIAELKKLIRRKAIPCNRFGKAV